MHLRTLLKEHRRMDRCHRHPILLFHLLQLVLISIYTIARQTLPSHSQLIRLGASPKVFFELSHCHLFFTSSQKVCRTRHL